jgi:hypothetical protein
MKRILEKTNRLQEIATVCRKTDGYGIVIEVHSEDHGVLGDENQPAHAHLKTPDNQYLGKFAITKEPPSTFQYVFDCDKKVEIPSNYKKIVVEWAKEKGEEDINNWSFLKLAWRVLH